MQSIFECASEQFEYFNEKGQKQMSRPGGLSFYRRRKYISGKIIMEIFSWIFGILAAILLAVALNYCLGMSTYVVGVSMEPTLSNGQRIFINRVSYTFTGPKAGDVIVFLPNGNRNAHYYVKRVVAVPGDKVQIIEGELYINGEVSDLISEGIQEAGIAANELTLEKGEYFCIGDSPQSSEDSRSAGIGPVDTEDIIGKVWLKMKSENNGMGFVE